MTKQNYELLIGKKFGDREILDIIKKHKRGRSKTYAVCKCKCGSIDDVPLSQLRAGKRLRCAKCADTNENKSTHMQNISYDRFNNNYVVTIARNLQKVVRRFRTLDEAILAKELLLEHFAKYGHFDTKKLNESYYTREPKPKSKHKPYKGKDYSYLIGQKLGNWEIVSVDALISSQRSQRNIRLRNERGNYKELRLKYALEALQQQSNKQIKVRSNTGIENISHRASINRYIVHVTRNSVKKTGYAKTLEEAIKIKERILKEFEKENITNG